MTQVEKTTIQGVTFVVTRTNPGGGRRGKIVHLDSEKFSIHYASGGWGVAYRPNSTRKWGVMFPNSTTLKNKAGTIRTFAECENAISAALEAVS